MQTKFGPHYTITPKILNALMRIEAAKERTVQLPLTISCLKSLRETTLFRSTHYSTMIEGNQLALDQVEAVLKKNTNFKGYERDKHEVQGYYAALTQMEKWALSKTYVSETTIKTIHALVMSKGKTRVKPTPYRDGQNVIVDSSTKTIVYMPPEAKDLPKMMQTFVSWINQNTELPCPLRAGIAHYQFVTIHPYYDGNGRVARLLATLILHLGGYDLKGLYSLEEYYAHNLNAYYEALSIGPSHNYYQGRAEADITKWIEYFIEGMTIAFENVLKHLVLVDSKTADKSAFMRNLDPRQRKVLELFQEFSSVTSRQIGNLLGLKSRAGALLASKWIKNGFLEIVDASNKGRKYKLSKKFENLL